MSPAYRVLQPTTKRRTIDLGYRPRTWQKECHLARKRFTVLALHRRAGKTIWALHELLDCAMRNGLDMPLYFYVAPQLKQAKAIAWLLLKRIVQPLELAGLAEKNESELWVRLTFNQAMIRLYGADLPDAMRGVRLDGVVVDEVAQIKPEVWDEVLQPALADRLGWAAFIGTPKGVNLFSKLFFDARGRIDWYSALYTVYDTEALAESEIARLKSAMPEPEFAREMLCDFSAAGEQQLLSLADIETAAARHLRKDQYEWAPMILGVDPARFGDDASVIFPRQGLCAKEPRVFHKLDNMAFAGHVAQAINDYQADAVMVDAGNGGGVIDRLRQLGFTVTEVNFGGKAPKPRYVNMRTYMWYEMAEWIAGGGVIPKINRLWQDLAAPTYEFTSTDQIALEPKDDIKARGLPSPDYGDALALTFAYPVRKETNLIRKLRSEMESRNDEVYDPLGAFSR